MKAKNFHRLFFFLDKYRTIFLFFYKMLEFLSKNLYNVKR